MPTDIVIIRHAGLSNRTVSLAEVLPALEPDLQAMPRVDYEINTRQFEPRIDQGDWEGQAAFIAGEAARIHAEIADRGDPEIHYFGLAEIPHVIALGAFIGDERPLVIHEFDRDKRLWKWPDDQEPIAIVTHGLPSGEPIAAQGSAILRLEISFAISDNDVREAAGTNHLAEIRITFAEGAPPEICKIRSNADLQAVREAIRNALSALRTKCPNLDTIHVFVAAPVSACFALGQELKPRNSPPIQTYRFRKLEDQPSYTAALALTGDLGTEAEEPLTEENVKTAIHVRTIWQDALREVENYAGVKGDQFRNQTVPWFEMLEPFEVLKAVRPFSPLMPISQAVPKDAKVDPNPVADEYGFTKPDRTWHLSDRLLIGFSNAVEGDDHELRRLIRLFLFHEYLHDFHSLTKYRAQGVGTFPNCLEYIDYTADTYALLHQLDFQRLRDRKEVESDELQRKFLVTQLELIIASFWAFERRTPVKEWQVRRLRRYLNWYWRLAQLESADSIMSAVRILARPPHVELAGLHQFARDRRLYCRLDKLDTTTGLELALVLENCKLLRVTDSTTSNLTQLLVAFQNRDHGAILRFFRGVYELADELGGAMPLS